MFLRTACAALIVLGAAAIAAAEPANVARGGAVARTEPAPATTARVRPGQGWVRAPIVVGPTIMEATTSVRCTRNGVTTTYTLSVGGGTCTPQNPVNPDGSLGPATGANCTGGSGDTASATCATGCGVTSGNGSCTIK